MSTVTGPNYSIDNQISFIVQWFRTWSELQKDDFVEILAQKLTPGSNMNGLVNGMQKLDTGSKRVSLFSCQIKLFNEWWQTWADKDKENLTSRLKESDPKFWATVQDELNGTRKKLEDDFFLTINTCVTSSSNCTNGENVDKGQISDNSSAVAPQQPTAITVTMNGSGLHDEDNLEGQDSNNEVINQNGIGNGENDEDDKEEDMEADGPSG